MARTAIKTIDSSVIVTDAETPGLPTLAEASKQEHIAIHQHEATVRAIASQIRYQLPADCVDADLIQRDISSNMRRSVEACLEVGRGLTVLKATCEYGNFLCRLDVLGIERSVAARFMQAARKMANVATVASFQKSIGSQAKLFELLILDDEQIEELVLTGHTGELALDDVAKMGVRELRNAVRKERADNKANVDATDRVMADKEAKITQLEKEIHKLRNKSGDWHPRAFEVAMEATACAGRALEQIDRLDVLRDVVLNEDFGEDVRDAAIESMAVVYFDVLDQVMHRLAEVLHARDAVFIGYKEKARPILEVFGQQGQEN